MLLLVQIESAATDPQQLDLVAFMQVVQDSARADFLLDEHFQVRVVRRARKSEVCRFFAGDAEDPNLTGNEIRVWRVVRRFDAMKIERTRQARLIADAADDEL